MILWAVKGQVCGVLGPVSDAIASSAQLTVFRHLTHAVTWYGPRIYFLLESNLIIRNQPPPDDEFEANIHAEVKQIRDRIDERAVCERASELNGGQRCEIEHPPAWGRDSLMGCANYHARIRFTDDSSVWLLRVPRISGGILNNLPTTLFAANMPLLSF